MQGDAGGSVSDDAQAVLWRTERFRVEQNGDPGSLGKNPLPTVSVDRCCGPKLGKHAYQLIDCMFYSSCLNLQGHALRSVGMYIFPDETVEG